MSEFNLARWWSKYLMLWQRGAAYIHVLIEHIPSVYSISIAPWPSYVLYVVASGGINTVPHALHTVCVSNIILLVHCNPFHVS
jgi:hypothetical protein